MIGLVTAFEMEAAKVGEDSSIRRMIRLVQSADAGKAKIVGIAMGGVGSDIAVDAADITLAIIGTLNPVAGALVHNAGSVLVITNAAFLLKWRKK